MQNTSIIIIIDKEIHTLTLNNAYFPVQWEPYHPQSGEESTTLNLTL